MLRRFLATESASGAVLLAAAVVALVWANSPAGDAYEQLWTTTVGFELGSSIDLDLELRSWLNDGAMALFFFVVALEIKRELVHGQLRDRRAAALPAVAALGGMVVPALVFTAFNAGTPGARGWGIPMATDIAFAVGVVTLLGPRLPTGAKLFLLSLAIVDDLGAIAVIAAFYTDDLALGWLAIAGAGVGAALVCRRRQVRNVAAYLALGVVVWLALHESGVHATLAGVAFGFATPARPLAGTHGDHGNHGDIESPLERLEARLTPWSAYLVVPLFALANSGLRLDGDVLDGALGDRVALGVGLGLVLGKTVGVLGASWLATKVGLGRPPAGTTWWHVLGLSITAGIGFTVAMLMTHLSFDDPVLADRARLAILGASVVAGLLGSTVLRFACARAPSGARGAVTKTVVTASTID